MSASTDILYHAHEHGYEFEEIGTTIDYDVDDPSSHSPITHGLTLVGNILTTIERKRPILILGVPGFISSFVGVGFGYWTLSNYINSGTFPLGLATTSGFLVLAGIFTCFTAIILHSLNTHFQG
jgi:zinc transporter ZupT